MNGSEYQQLQETAWRRPLTAAEQARLQAHLIAHPEAQDDWELDTELNQVLRDLPDAPLASNFTAQVLRAVERERATAARHAQSRIRDLWPVVGWKRAVTAGGIAVCAALITYQYIRFSDRVELAQSVARVSSMATMPSLEVLQDFDAINHLSQMSQGVDLDLLPAVQ